MEKLKKNIKGITMISLIITTILLIMISSIVTYSGLGSIRNNKFEKLKIELEIVQGNINLWYHEYIDVSYDRIDKGSPIPDYVLAKIQGDTGVLKTVKNITNSMNLNISEDVTNYRYFTKYDFQNLQIEGIENDYIIDIKRQIAILVDGYEYESTKYYIIDQVRDVVRGNNN